MRRLLMVVTALGSSIATVPAVAQQRVAGSAESRETASRDIAARDTAARVSSTAMTARQVMDRIKSELKGSWSDSGIDSFKDGDPDTPVTGIAVTMMATMDVLQRAVVAGLNLIITHEPTFYSHEDKLTNLELLRDPATAAKRAYIREHHLVVFRLHDHWHFPARAEDPVRKGVFRALGWEQYLQQPGQLAIALPPTTVGALASTLARKLNAHSVRVVGDRALKVTQIACLPGSAGFEAQRSALVRDDVEVVIIGEAREWETIPYVADLISQGRKKALIVLGHVPSEQAGSDELVRWLQPLLPDIKTQALPTADPFWTAKPQ